MKINLVFSNFIDYLKKVIEEVQKIKFPERREVVAMSIGVVLITLILGFVFYIVDFLSILLINNVMIGL